MRKLLMILSICAMAVTCAVGQDDAYYTGDAATITVRVRVAPPELPVYEQPPCPYDGYLWSPGYWAWSPDGYYWVPGVWVRPPHEGYLWTPGYWGFIGGEYGWHDGYCGEHIGYYGGVCYGFGYEGTGFYGGRWEGGAFRYNTAVWHVDNNAIHHTYSEGMRNTVVSHASYNGPGGVQAHPIPAEQQAMRENHVAATGEQQSHQKAAIADKNQFVSANHGKPAVAAMNTPNGQRFNVQGHPTTPAANNTHPANTGNRQAPVNNNAHTAQAPNNRIAPVNNNVRPQPMQNQPHTGPAPANRPAPVNNNQRPMGNAPNNKPMEQPARNNYQPQQTAPHNNMQQQHNNQPQPMHTAPQQQPRMQAPPQQQQPHVQPQQPQQQPHMQAPQQQPRMQAPPQQQQPHMQAPQGRPAEPAGGHPGERR